MADDEALSSVTTALQDIDEKIDCFLSYDKENCATILSALGSVFNFNKNDETICGRNIEGCPFEKLQLESTNVDNEVIWQQLQLQNESLLLKIRSGMKHLLKKQNTVRLNDLTPIINDKKQDYLKKVGLGKSVDFAEESSADFIEENIDDDEERPMIIENKSQLDGWHKGSVVDDQFFKLAEMEKFLEGKHGGGEMSGGESDENENINYFMDLKDDATNSVERDGTNPEDMMYSDYFNAPDGLSGEMEDDEKNSDDNMDESDEDSDNEDEKVSSNNLNISHKDRSGDKVENALKSTLERQQEKVKKQISALEESNVVAKSWQLTGETSASGRPSNSLLEEVLQFDHTTAAAPVITEETSKLLEDIIIQRIKDSAWDDVERKQKPVKEPYEYKKAQPINQEKSKMSLSEIYEKEYLQQQNPAVEKENEEHAEINKLMKSLFFKLDALSNYHFTPKPLKSEVTIVSNVPSVTIEECAPVSVSETALLAPEEVYDKRRREVKGKGEMTKQDRNRERRVKKRRQRLAAKEKAKLQRMIEKTNPGLGNKYSREKAMKKLEKDKSSTIISEKRRDTSLTSSSGFFTKLQDNVREEIYKKSRDGKKEKKNKTSSAHCRL